MTNRTSAAAPGLPALPTRRAALLASLAGVGVAAGFVNAVRTMPASDPIFAAIERHRAAEAAFVAACEPCGKVVNDPPHLEAARDAAAEAEITARYDMHETVPQTVAGLVAYVSYWSEHVGPYRDDRMGQLNEIGWEAFPTIAEAMATLLPAV